MAGAFSLKHSGPTNDHHLIECRDCGLFQRLHSAGDGDVAACRRCNATLRRTQNNLASLACTGASIALFLFAISSPLMTLRSVGRFSTGTVFTGPDRLAHLGMTEVAWLVLATLVVAPALKLAFLMVGLLGERAPTPPRWAPWIFGWLERLGPWAMVEVFVLGVIVAYTRMKAISRVDIGPALLALGGLTLTMTAADASLDRPAIWAALGRRLMRRRPGVSHGALVGCHVCRLVSRAADGTRCARCGHVLHRRTPDSVLRATALMLAALLLYIPANALPIMSVTRLGRGGSHTILGGVHELFEVHLWPLAIIVLLASVVVPLVKLGALAILIVATHRRASARLLLRTRVFRVIAVIGRWSMIDIFALTTLVALVRMGALATVSPGGGAIAFSAVVVLTMLATEMFDPRLMWDAARTTGPRALPSAARSLEPS